jgi:Glycosyltransferase family 87
VREELNANLVKADGLRMLALGAVVFLLMGALLANRSLQHTQDFSGVYYGARCLVVNADPYNAHAILRVYQSDSGNSQLSPVELRNLQVITSQVYLPTSLLLLVPLATLPFKIAFALWTIFTAAAFTLAVFLIWHWCSADTPRISGALLGLFLATSATLLAIGNPAGLVVAMCVVAVWSFFHEKFIPAGIICLAVSVSLKPHDVGFVWLFFLLIGGTYRKRALQTALLLGALSVPSVLWVTHLSPDWVHEIQRNLVVDGARGGANDPGPASDNIGGIDILVNMQSVFSVFRDEPHFYNLAAYLACAPLILSWLFVAAGEGRRESQFWLGLAAIAALSMLPLYHRQHDAKLLLLTFPACAMLWSRRGIAGWIALALNTAGVLLNGDIFTLLRIRLAAPLLAATSGLTHQILIIVLDRPVALILLVTGAFYLWIYLREDQLSRKVPVLEPATSSAGIYVHSQASSLIDSEACQNLPNRPFTCWTPWRSFFARTTQCSAAAPCPHVQGFRPPQPSSS